MLYSHSTMYLLKHQSVWPPTAESLHSHSTMYLLKPVVICAIFPLKLIFTFHHVSIKTISILVNLWPVYIFTFHHVSIKTFRFCFNSTAFQHSHSTMYLLKLINTNISIQGLGHSHSTMYLLKLNEPSPVYCINKEFTFHHVSIKTLFDNPVRSMSTFIHIPPCIY